MQFIFFPSKQIGINLDRIEWYRTEGMSNLTFTMVSGRQFFIDDEDEISLFFSIVELMELEEE